MKRLLSLTLILGMMLTLVGIVPAKAADGPADYPFTSYSFDENIDGFSSASYIGAWSEEGVGGKPGSLYVAQSNTAGDYNLPIKNAHMLIGNKVKISCWIKQDITRTRTRDNRLRFLLYGSTEVTATTYYYDWFVNTTGDLNSGEWLYYEQIVEDWDGVMGDENVIKNDGAYFSPRLSGTHSSGLLDAALSADSPEKVLAYWIDEFRVEPVIEAVSDEPAEPGVLLSESMSSPTTQLVLDGTFAKRNSATGHDGGIGYATWSSVLGRKAEFKTQPLNIQANTLYKVSLWAKADAANTVDQYPHLEILRGARLDKTNDSIAAGRYPAPYDSGDAKQVIRFDKPLTTEWQYMELYFERNVNTFDNLPLSVAFCVGTNTSGRKFSMDDFRIEEVEVGQTITNGDFETARDAYPASTYLNAEDGARDEMSLYGTFTGWFDQNVTVEASDDVAEESEGTVSAKITTTDANAEMHQGIFVANKSALQFTFRAKGEGESVGKSIQVKLDRTVENVDALDVYEVPDVELLGDNLTLEEEWKEYTVRYNPVYEATGEAEDGVIPRLPFFSIVVDGGAAGLTYYLDDIAMEVAEAGEAEVQPPYATGVSVSGGAFSGQTLTISYTFNSPNGGTEGNTLLRVMKIIEGGQDTVLDIVPLTGTYVVPEIAEGGQLRFDILPAEEMDDGTLLYGGFASYQLEETVRPAVVITPVLGAFNTAAETITGQLSVANNVSTADTLSMFLIVAVYDENDCALRYELAPISVDGGRSGRVNVTVSTAELEGFAPVAKVKAFVWGGTSVFDTDMTSYADVVVAEME